MIVRELAHDEWKVFFDGFSRRFRGRPMTLETGTAEDAESHKLADRLPLLGITIEPPHGAPESVQVMLGESPTQNIGHVIRQPARVLVAQVTNGEDEMLIIESATGVTTRVDFRKLVNSVGGEKTLPAADEWRSTGSVPSP